VARVVGLDLSLTASGAAMAGEGLTARVSVLAPPKKLGGGHGRLSLLRELCQAWWQAADLVLVEGPAYGSMSGAGHHESAGLWWMVTYDLWAAGVPVAVVPPSCLKKYAVGVGGGPKASKDKILVAAVRRFPEVDVDDNNAADALWLAAMGSDHLGQPLCRMPAEHREVLTAVTKNGPAIRWPELGKAA
jgi:hypothetical protein